MSYRSMVSYHNDAIKWSRFLYFRDIFVFVLSIRNYFISKFMNEFIAINKVKCSSVYSFVLQGG